MKRASYFPKENAEAILSAANLTEAEARFIVTDYYTSQEARKRADMQYRHIGEESAKETGAALRYMATAFTEIEATMLKALERFACQRPAGLWMMVQHGVGPVIAAGMLAHLDITKAPTAGHFWRFSGQDPSCQWKKGEKRPFNAAMKQLCYHFGLSVKRASKSPKCFYGAIYRSRKKFLVKRNEAGYNAERAKTFHTTSDQWRKTLAAGKLPDGNIDSQACNFAAKIFLSHLHAIMFWDRFGKIPPKPFAVAILGHAHEIRIPHADMFPGLEAAYYGDRVKCLEAAESTAYNERAVIGESAARTERAVLRESTECAERAANGESIDRCERAAARESTESTERAARDESTGTLERNFLKPCKGRD
jgi:hypothetical protein